MRFSSKPKVINYIYPHGLIRFEIIKKKALIFFFQFGMWAACGVCHSDLHVMKGEIPFSSPCAIGHEITGEVVEHGPLTDHKIIQRFLKLF